MSRRNDTVVVTGIGIVCGLGSGKARVLSEMMANRSGIGKIRSFDTTGLRTDIGAEVSDFDPSRYFPEGSAEGYDRCGQLAIAAATEALAESRLPLGEAERAGIGVVLGTCNGGILSLEHQKTLDMDALDPKRTRRFPFYVQAESVARFFSMGGPVITMNTACAASGNAIGLAADLIRKGYARAMLAGGADSMSMLVYAGFNSLQALNPEPCSPYSVDHGLTLGEAGGFLVLESAESARERGATIYAEICGYGLSNDGHHPTAPDPEGRGIAYSVSLGLRQAGVGPEQLGYVNTHGTGTRANDAAELRGLRAALGEHFAQTPVSSSKAYFGHTLGAAAVVEYISTLLPMREDLLPATLHFKAFREGCEDMRLVANEPLSARPTYFLCNNSAFGGHNVSIVSRNPKAGPAPRPEAPPALRVALLGTGFVGPGGMIRGPLLSRLLQSPATGKSDFSLKAFAPHLYERRMNRLTQMAIGAAHEALGDAGVQLPADADVRDLGLIFGTAHGSLESAEKYIGPIFTGGPTQASSVYFPDMVLNSTAGRLAEKFRLKGYASSLSTGGHEGLVSALYGYEAIRDALQPRCLVGAGDEHSRLMSAVQRAQGLERSEHTSSEGALFLMLGELEQARLNGAKVLAELLGFGLAHGEEEASPDSGALDRAIQAALETAGIGAEALDVALVSTPGRAGEQAAIEQALRTRWLTQQRHVLSFDSRCGYATSVNALLHLQFAAELVGGVVPPESMGLSRCTRALVVARTINGGYGAAVVGHVAPTPEPLEAV